MIGSGYEYDDFEQPNEEEKIIDPEVIKAKKFIRDIFINDVSKVSYYKQLEVSLEKKFFHWITSSAIHELIEEGFILTEQKNLFESKPTKVSFIFNKKNRYYKRKINEYLKIIKLYSDPNVAMGCGEQAELLFLNAFLKRGFKLISEDSNEFNGKKWTKTKHNLDFIIEKDNRVYGCEVKNTFAYIDHNELIMKLNICNFLQILPLFIMRYSPKTYNYEIISRQGYALIFETQIYPFGQEQFIKKIKEVLNLPVICSRAIPEGIIDRFMKWHNSVIQNL